MRIRQTELTTPGSNTEMMEKAASSAADEVMLDLEDAVAPDEKKSSREKIINAIHGLDWAEKTVAMRINGLGTRYAHGDLIKVIEAAGDALDVVIVPKVKRAADVTAVDSLLDGLEADNEIASTIGIEVLIEETEAMQNVDEIAAASDRLEALIFGPGDYSAAQGVDLDKVGGSESGYPGDLWHSARNHIVVAARSNGLDAIDGPFSDFSDPDGYRRECEWSKALGFVGKWAIHPSQIEIANEVYAPDEADIERAEEIVDVMERGQDEGRGALQLDGEMIDDAVLRQAQTTLERARAIGLVD